MNILLYAPHGDSTNIALSLCAPLQSRFSLSVSVLIPHPRPRAYTSITARNAITSGGTGGLARAGRFSKEPCVRGYSDLSSSISSFAAACKLSTRAAIQNLGADNRYGDILLLRDAKIESYI